MWPPALLTKRAFSAETLRDPPPKSPGLCHGQYVLWYLGLNGDPVRREFLDSGKYRVQEILRSHREKIRRDVIDRTYAKCLDPHSNGALAQADLCKIWLSMLTLDG
jgi:hypothetical protein